MVELDNKTRRMIACALIRANGYKSLCKVGHSRGILLPAWFTGKALSLADKQWVRCTYEENRIIIEAVNKESIKEFLPEDLMNS